MDLNLYSSEFEGRFFDQTRLFYKAEGDRLIEEMDMSAYLDYVAKRVHQESTLRMKHYFDKSSKAAITTIVEDQLLSDRIQVILDKSKLYTSKCEEFVSFALTTNLRRLQLLYGYSPRR
jgi:cullin-4